MYDLDSLVSSPPKLAALRRAVVSGDPAPRLKDAKIKITSKCNLRCQMCHYWETETEVTLGTDRWRGVLNELSDLGCQKVHFSGGEPFLRRDFVDIVEHSVELGMKTNITTNGTLCSKSGAYRLVDAGTHAVSISLDGPTSKVHDRIRGQDGAFKRSLKTIKWLARRNAKRKKPLRIRINFVVMRDNYRDVVEMTRLAGELGASDLVVMPVDDPTSKSHRLSRGQIERYNRDYVPEAMALRRQYGFDLRPERVFVFGASDEAIRQARGGAYAQGYFEENTCLVPWLHTFVAWNGDVFLCCMSNQLMNRLGNVTDDTVEEVFRGPRYREIRERFVGGDHLEPCHRCDLFAPENRRLNDALDLPKHTTKRRRLSVVD